MTGSNTPAGGPGSGKDREGEYRRILSAARIQARDAWRQVGEPGCCGFATVKVPARTGFARWLADVGYGYRIEDSPGVNIHTEDDFRELAGGDPDYYQSLPHRIAYSQALATSLTQAGIKGIKVDSQID